MGILSNLLSGGVVGSLERVATEFIETSQEKAEAASLFIKTLDPNGKMRRDLSRFTCRMYGFYLTVTVALIFIHALSDPAAVGEAGTVVQSNTKEAVEAITSLFLPVTGAFTAIVSASFGVNGMNAYKGAP